MLTRAYVESDLNARWLSFFIAPGAQINALEEEIIRRLGAVALPMVTAAPLDETGVLAALFALDNHLANLRYDQSRLRAAAHSIDLVLAACENRSAYANQAITSIGSLAIGNVTMPEANLSLIIFYDPSYITTVVSVLWDDIVLIIELEKRSRARAAIAP